jgi:hypothetical protein
MCKVILPYLITILFFSLSAQTVAISGNVIKENGQPIKGAVVTLVSKMISDTTDASGKYSLIDGNVALNQVVVRSLVETVSLKKGVLAIHLTKPAEVQTEIFSLQGTLLKESIEHVHDAGDYRFNIMNGFAVSKVMLVRVRIGVNSYCFQYFPFNGGYGQSFFPVASRLGVWGANLNNAVDSLLVLALGYTPKSVAVTSYKSTVDITLDTLICNANPPKSVNVQLSGKPFTGSHAVVVETDPGLSGYTVYRPKELGAGDKYPIVVWGEGGCSLNGTSHPEFLGEIASHGYLVISDGTPDGSGGRTVVSDYKALGQPLLAAITWAIKENSRPCSQYFHSLDTTRTASFGWSCGGLMTEGIADDPRISTIMLNNSGMVNFDQKIIDGFHTPVLIIVGGNSDMATPNGTNDYNKISTVPAVLASTEVGHGGTYDQDNGGSFAAVDIAWLNWWLKDDVTATGKGMFVGANCGLCSKTEWTLRSKNIP